MNECNASEATFRSSIWGESDLRHECESNRSFLTEIYIDQLLTVIEQYFLTYQKDAIDYPQLLSHVNTGKDEKRESLPEKNLR